MRLQSISIFNFSNINNSKNAERNRKRAVTSYSTSPMYNAVSFEARVDKGLVRFYEVNKDVMPKTVRKHIESLDDLTTKTPLETHEEAFELIKIASNVEDIKDAYPEEELFFNLRNPEDILRATRGIIGTYREYKDLFETAGKSILADRQNLTVWLVKKIFLEGKTINEMNEDFKQEVDSDFIEFYRAKEKNSDEPIQNGVLNSLGIQIPESQNSLWYTKDGVSDAQGVAISVGKRIALENMTQEELIARNKKTIEPLESWWKKLPYDRKLQMIADQEDELALLQIYKESGFEKQTSVKKAEQKQTTNNVPRGFKIHTLVDTIFSEDEIFKIWAGNQLKLFEAKLSDYDKEIINNKRLQRRAEAWSVMTPEEKTDYLEKLKTGNERSSYALIQAWNENPEIITELSYFLRKNHIDRPIDALYDTLPFNKYMSETMSKFWASNPGFGEKLGESLRSAHVLINKAVADGTFEALKKDISRARDQRKKETAMAIRNYREILTDSEYNSYPDYMKEFIDGMRFAPDIDYKTLPSQYLKDFFKISYENLSQEEIATWIKVWKKEALTDSDRDNIQKIMDLKTPESEKMNRTLELSLANALYKCTKNPKVYMLSANHCKLAMKQIADGRDYISIPLSDGNFYDIKILNRNISVNEIDDDYNLSNAEYDDNDLGSIIDRYITFDIPQDVKFSKFDGAVDVLMAYLRTYGASLGILFVDENKNSTEIREAFLKKFMEKMPGILHICGTEVCFNQKDGFVREEKISQIDNKLRYKLHSIPASIMDVYIYEANKRLRKDAPTEELDNLLSSSSLGDKRIIEVDRKNAYPVNQYSILAAEQALADTMYEVTGAEDFYKYQFGALLLAVQNAASTKKFPSVSNYKAPGEAKEFVIKHKPNLYKLNKQYNKYLDEIFDYVTESVNDNKKIDSEEILYILNPDETKESVDKYTKERIKKVEEYIAY